MDSSDSTRLIRSNAAMAPIDAGGVNAHSSDCSGGMWEQDGSKHLDCLSSTFRWTSTPSTPPQHRSQPRQDEWKRAVSTRATLARQLGHAGARQPHCESAPIPSPLPPLTPLLPQGLADQTLSEFLIHLHSQCATPAEFKAQCAQVGADFPDSFLTSVDRLILSMHPKYKKKVKKSKGKKGAGGEGGKKSVEEEEKVLDEDRKRQMRLFPGLAMPDSEWQPSYLVDPKSSAAKGKATDADLGVDDLMAQLEGVGKRAAAGEGDVEDSRGQKRPRDGRSRSPDGRRARSPDYGRGSDSRGGDRGRDGYGARGGGGRPRMDDKPVLYKVYPGKVATIKDFGAFVSLEGVAGRAEGESIRSQQCFLAHISLQVWSTLDPSALVASPTPPTSSRAVNLSLLRSCPTPADDSPSPCATLTSAQEPICRPSFASRRRRRSRRRVARWQSAPRLAATASRSARRSRTTTRRALHDA